MFTFLNTIEVIPPTQVDFIERTLAGCHLVSPVVLRPSPQMPGYVAFHAWIPKFDSVCRNIPTEVVVCVSRRAELREIIVGFACEVQKVAALIDGAPTETPKRWINAPKNSSGAAAHGGN
jgi:hypothetical protein